MRSYSVFAQYYDELTSNVEYPKRAEYLLELMERLGHAPGLTLDLACGTGSLTLELYKRGVDIYGIDGSVEMLSEARTKCAEAGADILFLCQNMLSIDLYGTVDTALCTLDSLNHYCVWQNRCHAGGKVDIQLDFFEPEGGLYARSTERFSERAYPVEEVLERLSKAGFGEVQVFDELTFNPPREDSQRLVFAAKKRER